MLEGKTRSGFKYKIDERTFVDMRFLDAIALSQEDDESSQIRGFSAIKRMIFKDCNEAYEKHIAKKNGGFVPIEVVTDDITGIMEDNTQIKNS